MELFLAPRVCPLVVMMGIKLWRVQLLNWLLRANMALRAMMTATTYLVFSQTGSKRDEVTV